MTFARTIITALFITSLSAGPVLAGQFVLATTTSTENSGLLDALIPQFQADTGHSVQVVAVGTGQALEMGRRGDAAALLTHDRLGEEAFVENGYGTDRRDVMYNDFILVGPVDDPLQLNRFDAVIDALALFAGGSQVFVSRGDDSGTHRKELRLWQQAGIDPQSFGGWYRETGAGMGNTLLTTLEMNGYTLSDRSTWLKFNAKGDHAIVFEGDPPLYNPYSSILVTNDVVSAEEREAAGAWHDWLTSETGRNAIRAFTLNGEPLFFIAGDEADDGQG